MPKNRLTAEEKRELLVAKIIWDSGGCIKALVRAIEAANQLMAGDIRVMARRAVMGSRDDSNPFPRDVLSKRTGQFTKKPLSVARPPGKPPAFRKRNSLNQIKTAIIERGMRVQVYGFDRRISTVKPRISIVGPVRGGAVTGEMIGNMTVARKGEYGGSQSRHYRLVPAIKQFGKRKTQWDGDYRWEFARDANKFGNTPEMKHLWYYHLSKKGIIPKQKWSKVRGDAPPEHNIDVQNKSFNQKDRPYMRVALKKAMSKRRKYLTKAKEKFPAEIRRWVKAGKTGFRI